MANNKGPAMVPHYYDLPSWGLFSTPGMVQGSQVQSSNTQQLLLRGGGGGARPLTPQGPGAETMAQGGGGMPQGMQRPDMVQGIQVQNPNTQQLLLRGGGGGARPLTPQGPGAETMAQGGGRMPQGMQGPDMNQGIQVQNPNTQQLLLRGGGGGARPLTPQGPGAETMAQGGGRMPQGMQGPGGQYQVVAPCCSYYENGSVMMGNTRGMGTAMRLAFSPVLVNPAAAPNNNPGLPCKAEGGQQNAELKSSWSKHNLVKEDEMQKKPEFDSRISNSSPPIECSVENLQLLSPPLEPCSLNGSNTDNHKMKNKFDSMNNVPNHTRQEMENESCTCFGRYVTAELKQMPKQQRIRAKGLLAKIFLRGEVGSLQMHTTVTALNIPSAQQKQHISFNEEFDSTNNMPNHREQELNNECFLFGQLVAAHLQVMSKIQKALAQRLMSEILFRGELEFLQEDTTLLY